MTALLTLEAAAAEDYEVKITREMVAVEGSSMGLLPDNVVTLRTLACGMLMRSGNDAANAAAISPGRQSGRLCPADERKGRANRDGEHQLRHALRLDAEEHYSTAYDMALLGAYAMENADFAEIVGRRASRWSLWNRPSASPWPITTGFESVSRLHRHQDRLYQEIGSLFGVECRAGRRPAGGRYPQRARRLERPSRRCMNMVSLVRR